MKCLVLNYPLAGYIVKRNETIHEYYDDLLEYVINNEQTYVMNQEDYM